MPDSDRPSSDPRTRPTAGRSADARGATGTDADTLAPRAGDATGDTRMGGIPSTADSALSPSMSGTSDLSSDGPTERERPVRDDADDHDIAAGAARAEAADDRHGRRPGGVEPGRPSGRDDEYRGETVGGVPQRTPRQERAEAHDDGPLESIGKAVSSPVRGAADPEDDRNDGP